MIDNNGKKDLIHYYLEFVSIKKLVLMHSNQ